MSKKYSELNLKMPHSCLSHNKYRKLRRKCHLFNLEALVVHFNKFYLQLPQLIMELQLI